MPLENSRFFVISGGPGAGKTTVLDLLKASGNTTTVEAGRAIIQDQVAIDGPALPWRDRALFAEQMLAWEMRSYAEARRIGGPVFFDRGVPDIDGYLTLCDLPVPPHVTAAVGHFRYNRRVFLFPPWREIFHQDGERKQDFSGAERTFVAVRNAYLRSGYDCETVAPAPAETRAAFILDRTS